MFQSLKIADYQTLQAQNIAIKSSLYQRILQIFRGSTPQFSHQAKNNDDQIWQFIPHNDCSAWFGKVNQFYR